MTNNLINHTDPTGHCSDYIPCETGTSTEEEQALAVAAISLLPLVGDVIDVYDFGMAIYEGDYGEAALIATLAAALGSARAIR